MYDQQRTPRPMVQGQWTCSGCGASITELPFEPDGNRPIYCRDCHRQRAPRRDNRDGGGSSSYDRGPRMRSF